jgi:hypothetical protein
MFSHLSRTSETHQVLPHHQLYEKENVYPPNKLRKPMFHPILKSGSGISAKSPVSGREGFNLFVRIRKKTELDSKAITIPTLARINLGASE